MWVGDLSFNPEVARQKEITSEPDRKYYIHHPDSLDSGTRDSEHTEFRAISLREWCMVFYE